MRFDLWQRLRRYRPGGLAAVLARFFRRIFALLKIPTPDPQQWLQRIEIMERNIILPIKAAGIAMLLYSFYFTPWIRKVSTALDVELEATQYFLWVYIALNLAVVAVLQARRHLPLGLVQGVVFGISLADGLFVSALTLVTGGYESILYWLFLGLIVRTAVSVPRATSQILLSLTLSACYVVAGVIDVSVASNLDEESRLTLKLSSLANPAEPLLLRVTLLLLMTVCCYGVQVLLERQRLALEEAREFATREGLLRSAGRLAAEFAHQIKNPLAIINTAAFSLQRALKDGKTATVTQQIEMIQEEIQRSDRIMTQIMGYAQLSEGHVERLSVTEELDNAIARVFPPAAGYPVQVHRDYGPSFPPLLMQRRHVAESFINVLQNAREALDGKGGNVFVTARCRTDLSIEVSIRDDGPGIPADKQEKIFEAYYTTKEKGTGLGLATVKHTVELYGGTVRVESELGKGARFTLLFPAKTLMKLAETS